MAIQEKPTKIEFSYIDKNNKKTKMVYEETQDDKHIIICDEVGNIKDIYSVSFFEEVFQFLCEKNIINKDKDNKKIAFTNIKKKEDKTNDNTKPFSSFQKQKKQGVGKTDKTTKHKVEKTDDKTFVVKKNNIKNDFRITDQPQGNNNDINNDNLPDGGTGESQSDNERRTI